VLRAHCNFVFMSSLPSYREQIDSAKRRILVAALKQHGSMRRAAIALGISVATVSRDCRLLGIRLEKTSTVAVS